MQPDDVTNAMHRNEEIRQLLRLWMWCSRSLRVKWEREQKNRNTCLIGICWAVNGGRLPQKTELSDLVRDCGNLPFPLFSKAGLRCFWNVCPSTALEMALGYFTEGSPLFKKLELVRQNHQSNPRLDKLFKKMTAREDRFGFDWPTDGHHPESDFAELEREIGILLEELERLIIREHANMEALARKVLAQGWQIRALPASLFVRRTPESLLNRTVRLKLWLVAQKISFRNLDENGELEALCEGFNGAITPAIKRAIEAQGYTVDHVVDDFLNFDRYKSREEITQETRQ